MKSTSPASDGKALSTEEAGRLLAALQSELVGLKTVMGAKVASLEEGVANQAQGNRLLTRRLFGNKTERSHTSETQLAPGDLLASEARLQKELDAPVATAKEDTRTEPQGSASPSGRANPKDRRDVPASNLPRFVVEILDEELAAKGRRIGCDDSAHLRFRRGGFSVLVAHVARYEVVEGGTTTAVTAPSPETLFPCGCYTPRGSPISCWPSSAWACRTTTSSSIWQTGVWRSIGESMGRYVEQAGATLGGDDLDLSVVRSLSHRCSRIRCACLNS